MKKTNIFDLMFEVGRDCNFHCPHCLRGNAQNVEMKKETIDRVLSQVSSISSLIITGGEPFLYPHLIQHITSGIIDRKIPVGSFFIATNGSIWDTEIATSLIHLWAHCDDKECCELKISDDAFHENARNAQMWKAFSFTSTGHELKEKNLINEGKAMLNYNATRRPDENPPSFDGDYMEEGLVYINAFGKVLFGCDYSYESQEDCIQGDVYKDTLYDIVHQKNDED